MKRMVCLLLAVVLALSGCTSASLSDKTLFCMDTVMELTVMGKNSQAVLEQLRQLLQQLEQTWSVTGEDSLLTRLHSGQPVDLTAEQQALLDKAQALSLRTGGAFQPKLYNLSKAWGFYGQAYQVPSQEQIQTALAQPQWDLGGIVKGYAGSRCAQLLEETGMEWGILSLGGNIQTFGEKGDGTPWRIGLQSPWAPGNLGILEVTGTQAVVTSGDYQRFFIRDGVTYHHILDPQTGYPAQSGLRSVTVICADGATADALSTALFVMGLEKATAFWQESTDFEAVFVTDQGRILATEGVTLTQCEYEVIGR